MNSEEMELFSKLIEKITGKSSASNGKEKKPKDDFWSALKWAIFFVGALTIYLIYYVGKQG